MPFAATWIDLEIIILRWSYSHTKGSMWDRERQIPYDITYMESMKIDTNEHIYETEVNLKI